MAATAIQARHVSPNKRTAQPRASSSTIRFSIPALFGRSQELINNDELGSLYYYDSTRINLGLFQKDVNCLAICGPRFFNSGLIL